VRETRDWAGISFHRVAPGAHISQVTLSINVYDASLLPSWLDG